VQAKKFVDYRTKVFDAQKELANEMGRNKKRTITALTSLADMFLAKLLNHDDGQNIQVLWEASLAIIRQYSQGSVKKLLEEKGPEVKEECWVQNRH